MQPSDLEIIEEQLGRPPVGVQEVMVRHHDKTPAVIRVASFVDGNPFPTLFWLSDQRVSKLVYDLESRGMTETIQQQVDQSPSFQEKLELDNENHVALRTTYFSEEVVEGLRRLGIEEEFQKKGIGGNANFSRVRCLHAYLAAHLVVPNLVGQLLLANIDSSHDLCSYLSQLN